MSFLRVAILPLLLLAPSAVLADPVAVGQGDADANVVGISLHGNSTGFIAVSGTGNARGQELVRCEFPAVIQEGPRVLVVITLAGTACGNTAVSGTGHASGTTAASGGSANGWFLQASPGGADSALVGALEDCRTYNLLWPFADLNVCPWG